MAATTSKTLTRKRSIADSALMPPPPPVKRLKRPPKVLDEETYTSALSHIIARDFFPGLLETETQQEFLDALDAGDEEWINEAEKRVREVMATPRLPFRRPQGVGLNTPPPHKTPLSTPIHTPRRVADATKETQKQESQEKEEKVDLNLSLGAFQAKYTSEDNESFDAIVDRQNAKRAEKYAWLWNENKLPSARQIAQAAHNQRKTISTSDSSSSALILRPSQDLDDRPASISLRPDIKPKNGLMFIPESIEDTHPEHKSIAEAAQDASNAPPKSVSYASTRLLLQPVSSTDSNNPSVPASPSLSAIDRAIRGNVEKWRSASGPATGANSIALSVEEGPEAPQVNGWTYVDAEPTPSELGSEATTSAAATKTSSSNNRHNHPLLEELKSAHTKGGGFKIAEPRDREKLHHRIVARQLASNNRQQGSTNKNGTAGGAMTATPTPTPRTPLTPAARQLYTKLSSTPLQNQAIAKVGTVDWNSEVTPKRKNKGTGTGTPLRIRRVV